MAWNDRSNGLSSLSVNYITQRPSTRRLKSTSHELLAASDGGIDITFNGGRDWNPLTLPDPSNAEFADAPAAVIGDLIFHWVSYGKTDDTVFYCLGVKTSVNRQWLYKSIDAGNTWISRGIVTA